MSTSRNYTPEQIQAMREWIDDCAWPDMELGGAMDLTTEQVLTGIAKHYEGGISQFLIAIEG